MTTYNTGNPLGSTAAKDLFDNAQNLDIAVNSEELTWLDRGPSGIHRLRKTFAGIEQDARDALEQVGYIYTVPLNYAAGITITLPNEIFLKDGEYYKPGPGLALPYTTTGVWATEQTLFRSVGDATLRTALASAGGVNLVNGALRQVENVTTLRATVARYDGESIQLLGHTVRGLGAGTLTWEASSTATDDNGSSIAVTGVVSGRWLRDVGNGGLDITDFGALCTGTGATGVGADDTIAVNNALVWAQLRHQKLTIKPQVAGRVCRVTSPLAVVRGLQVEGFGVEPFIGLLSTTTKNVMGAGSWLYFDHAGVGIYVNGDSGATTGASGFKFKGFGTLRNQPTPGAGVFTPAANDFDFDIKRADCDLSDLMLLNPTKAILHRDGSFGRLTVDNVRGQPFLVGVELRETYDVCRISRVHWWPFWSGTQSVYDYQAVNLNQFIIGRADNCVIDNCFGFYSRRMFAIVANAAGPCNKLRISNCDADATATLITINADSATISIENTVQQASQDNDVLDLTSGSSSIEWSGGYDGYLQLSNVSLEGAAKNGILMWNGINRIQAVNLRMGNWGKRLAGAPGIDFEGINNVLELANPLRVNAYFPGSGDVFGGVGLSGVQITAPMSSGVVTGATTSGAGDVTFSIPDMGVIPREVLFGVKGTVPLLMQPTSISRDTIVARVFKATDGTALVSGPVSFSWKVEF